MDWHIFVYKNVAAYVCLILILCISPLSASFLNFKWLHAVKCYFSVCCGDPWIKSNFTGLQIDLNAKLHGQHLVKRAILGHVMAHFQSDNPSKALVLSFHGPTGVGKNFVARIIAENVYKDGMRSKFVHLLAATKEFQHEGMVHLYKERLKDWIEGNVSVCGRSMFIFDEIDKLDPTLLNTIKPYLDYYDNLGGVDYRKATFIFLSNSGSSAVVDHLMKNWRAGNGREELQLHDLEHDLMLAAINDERQGGLWHSQLISNNLITGFIPFLPLEKYHVRQCILDALIEKGYFQHNYEVPDKIVDQVMDELKFMPEREQILSATGCKRVGEKVDFVMVDIEIDFEKIRDKIARHKDEF